MSEDINVTTMVGNLTRDSELTYTSGGTALLKMSVAVNESVKKGNEWVEQASFFDLNLWGQRAEKLVQYTKKGQKICIDARAKQERWEQGGVKRSKVVFNVHKLQLLGSHDN